MTAEQFPPPAPETQNPRTPTAEFLYRVFDESVETFKREKEASPVAELRSQFIRRWNGNVFNMVKGLILRSERHDYGLTMGVRGFSEEPDDRLMMEFGKISHPNQSFDETLKRWSLYPEEKTPDQLKLSYLDSIVHQPDTGTYGSGRFYVDYGTVEVDCWVDRRIFGGREMGRFPYGESQSVAGLADYVNIVRELTNRSWR